MHTDFKVCASAEALQEHINLSHSGYAKHHMQSIEQQQNKTADKRTIIHSSEKIFSCVMN